MEVLIRQSTASNEMSKEQAIPGALQERESPTKKADLC